MSDFTYQGSPEFYHECMHEALSDYYEIHEMEYEEELQYENVNNQTGSPSH